MPKLHGTITVHGDKPASTAVVELHNAQGDTLDQVQVDEDGNYIYHLVAGTWTLNVWDAHGHRAHVKAEIVEGTEDTVVDVKLDEPEGGH